MGDVRSPPYSFHRRSFLARFRSHYEVYRMGGFSVVRALRSAWKMARR